MKPAEPIRCFCGLLAVFALLLMAPAAQASPIFSAVCWESHISNDDPIAFPGQPGVSHDHDYAGAMTANAFSTFESLRASDTTCNQPDNASSYWHPSLFRNGVRVPIKEQYTYYQPGEVEDLRIIKPMPAGLKLLAAMHDLPFAGWRCDGQTASQDTIPDCGTGRLQARVYFRNCLAVDAGGVPLLDSPDHKSHAAYSGDTCPASHPYPIPALQVKTTYDTNGGAANWTIATGHGDHRSTTGNISSYHADFFNGWKPETMASLTKTCLNDDPPTITAPCELNGVRGPRNPNYPNAMPSQPPPPPPPAVCADGVDNDGDGMVDYPADPGCASATDGDEYNAPPPPPPPACADTIDNDLDGLIDLSDPGCSSSTDDDETNAPPTGDCSSPTITYTGRIESSGSYKVHERTTTVDGTLKGCLTSTIPDATLVLYKSISGSMREVARAQTAGTSGESITYVGTAGKYRWRVQSASGGGDYTLKAVYP